MTSLHSHFRVGTPASPDYRMGFDVSIAFIEYGERWRTYRRISHRVMSVNAVQMYDDILAKEAIRLVRWLVQDPQSYREQIRL